MIDNGWAKNEEIVTPEDFSWFFWFTLPLYPFGKRRTIRTEVIKDTIWTFDQLQGIFYVVVPIRMTVVKLEGGGLLVYAPVAPTRECIRLLNELVVQHGEVKYIILSTISGLEHKVFVGPFARCFPQAQVFVIPKQWSFPLNLPLSWLGLPSRRTSFLPEDSSEAPFAKEFEYTILGPIELGPGRFAEVAFFHKRSHTLLITDSVVSVPEEPPAIVQLDPYPLLFHAKDNGAEIIENHPINRRKGWQRISLFALYFQPSLLEIPGIGEILGNALKAQDKSKKAYFGIFPFKWNSQWQQSFAALRGNGRILVAPVLQTLILNRAPKETIDWVNRVASWDFELIIPCHFDSPIKAQASQFRQAFSFLEKYPSPSSYSLPEVDLQRLKTLEKGLYKFGIIPASKEKI